MISTATIAAYVALGGLGRFIIDGLAVRDFPQMIAGSLLVAVLAVATDLLLAGLQRLDRVAGPACRTRPAPAACCPLEDPRRRTCGVTGQEDRPRCALP